MPMIEEQILKESTPAGLRTEKQRS